GRYPMAVLSIALPPEEVDVNIHPTKREVRFRQARDVFTAVQRAVRTTLMSQYPVPDVGPAGVGYAWQHPQAPDAQPSAEQTRLALDLTRPGAPAGPVEPVTETLAGGRLPMLRVVGQVGQTYIVAEGPGGLYLIDQHAAHERITYEALRAQRAVRAVASQELLDPLPIDVSPQQAALLEARLDDLAAFGLELAPFGGLTYVVRRIPASLVGGDIAAALLELLDAVQRGGADLSWEDQALISLSCHGAVRAGQTLSTDEMRDLVRQLERCELPHTCPHGRPTIVHLSQERLEREFGRR
ncbi:MAG: DNA mismatch repair protein MutL, partial [Chloroflexi bacterium]|nr:DNA mismatch repair protein MutL [Chloroflexota bacterium]